ncbi:MAG: GNAT family N-acetyltransferase [Betaproteobacteria bacterium]|nr:MAG: GNAT family N-acetyltransferase [Betaproteobacteria bacterium]
MIEFRQVDRFTEPAFSSMQREVFAIIPGARVASQSTAKSEVTHRYIHFDPDAQKVRIGAFDAVQLVGWSIGWQLTPERFYMSNSGVVARYQRRGIYSHLVAQMLDAAAAMGCSEVVSQHLPDNRAVLEAKAKLGFVRDGFCFSDEFGEMVRLRHSLRT